MNLSKMIVRIIQYLRARDKERVDAVQRTRYLSTRLGFALLTTMCIASPSTLMMAQTAGSPIPLVDFNAATSSGVQTNGKVLGPGLYFGQLAMEAEGRQAVILVGQAQYVSFTLTSPANAITVHYAIPDAPAGNGLTEPLSLYVNNQFTTSLSLTSAYSWLYGAYPYSKTPTIGTDRTQAPHDFYNDVRYMFSSTLPKGTVVKLQVDSGDNAPWYIINTADFETVPSAIAQPANSINVTQAPYNADDTGGNDVTSALQSAINAGSSSGQIIYLPTGTYKVSSPLSVNNVTVEGAGEWYTMLTGSDVGFTGNENPASTNVNISNLALFDNATIRDNSTSADTGFNGGFSNSTISDVWIQNEKSGMFVLGPTTGLTLNGLRIMDLKADGINFWAQDGAITNSTIENSYIRNSQDDSIALFAQPYADTGITVNQNTVISPGLANAIAVYGSGSGDMITNNLLMDPVQAGSCINDGLRFSAIANSGTLTIQGNTLQQCGMFDPGFFFGWGAIWFYPEDGNIAATENISNNTIEDSPYSAYMFLGPNSTTGVNISNDTITNVGTYVVHTQGDGAASISSTSASGVTDGGYLNLGCSWSFNLTTESDTGWSSSSENCNIPAANPLWVYPDVATFQTTQGATVTQKIAVYNASYQTTTLGAITASSGFTVSADASNPCGSSLQGAVNGGSSEPGYCLVDVTFGASASGITTGTLTIPSSAPNSPAAIMLVGSTGGNSIASTPTVTPTSLSFGNIPVGTTSTALTVTLSNPIGAAATSVSIVASNSFSETNNCGSTLAAGASCTISVTFTAPSVGVVSGVLSITNSETSSPLTVPLSGTGTSAPTAPTGLSAAPAGSGVIALSWTASTGTAPITYNVYRGTASGGESTTPITTGVNATTYADTSVSPGSTYYYKISATNSIGSSGTSAEASATAESAVVQIDAGGGATGTFAADEYFSTGTEFTTSSTVSTADVINPAPEAVYQSVRWAPSFTYTVPGLSAGASYTVRLHFAELSFSGAGERVFNVAINGTTVLNNFDVFAASGGENVALVEQFNTTATSSGNIVISFTQGTADNPDIAGIEVLSAGSVTRTAPSVPAGLSASSGNASVALTWSASTGTAPITYNVYRGTSSGGESTTPIATSISSTSYTDSGLTNGTTYYYKVSSTNSVATSAQSAEASAKPQSTSTAPSVPAGLTAAAGNTSVALSWSASTGTTPITYNVYRGTSSGGESTTPIATSVSSTSYTDSGLTNGTTYYYKVSSTNSVTTSAQSAEASATPTVASNALVQINAGGAAVSPFIADTDFNNGNVSSTTTAVSTAGITNAAPQAVYQSVRWAPAFTYIVPGLTPGSSYTVRLHFAELTFAASGERIFNVAINGTTVLNNFDIYATAGAQYKAVVEQFTATADALGQITISFTQGSADNPEVAGIEILGSGTLGQSLSDVLEIDAGSGTAISPFVADQDFNTGNECSSSATITTTNTSTPAPAAVYQTCRWASSFTYTIPGLSAGATYAVRLHFAELTFSGAGERAFNVAINGTAELNNFDIYATSGAANQAITEQFDAAASSAGQIVIAFTAGSADNPEVNGIEVLQ
jgi:hypothetical protein